MVDRHAEAVAEHHSGLGHAGCGDHAMKRFETWGKSESRLSGRGSGGLVQLYEAMGKQDEAAKWRKELEAIKAAQAKPANRP